MTSFVYSRIAYEYITTNSFKEIGTKHSLLSNLGRSHLHNREEVLCSFGYILNEPLVDICIKMQLLEQNISELFDNISIRKSCIDHTQSDTNNVTQAIFDLNLDCKYMKNRIK